MKKQKKQAQRRYRRPKGPLLSPAERIKSACRLIGQKADLAYVTHVVEWVSYWQTYDSPFAPPTDEEKKAAAQLARALGRVEHVLKAERLKKLIWLFSHPATDLDDDFLRWRTQLSVYRDCAATWHSRNWRLQLKRNGKLTAAGWSGRAPADKLPPRAKRANAYGQRLAALGAIRLLRAHDLPISRTRDKPLHKLAAVLSGDPNADLFEHYRVLK